MKTRAVTVAAIILLAGAGSARALDLHAERSSPYDLALTGKLAGVPEGVSRYVRWPDLRALPTSKLTMNGEFIDGPQELTVVFLDDLWKALPVEPGADCVLATCADGYASVFTSDFISRYRPFLVLEINGKGPKDWPPPGLDFNPGPFVITVSDRLVPSVALFRDLEHKKPWGVTTLEIASFTERYRPIFTGRWASLSAAARDGRDIWINSCACCHKGPGGKFGGTKANRPFEVLAAYAGYDRAFFTKYVRDPKSLVPCAKMEPHPNYTDEDLADLIAFIVSG
jgi:hypothetical protein